MNPTQIAENLYDQLCISKGKTEDFIAIIQAAIDEAYEQGREDEYSVWKAAAERATTCPKCGTHYTLDCQCDLPATPSDGE